ncbi:MAG: tetratricopeptide repeat protein [Limnohabitans sp.]|nr:tetratricopeptide repeat protein [Limnohabitans sp.]
MLTKLNYSPSVLGIFQNAIGCGFVGAVLCASLSASAQMTMPIPIQASPISELDKPKVTPHEQVKQLLRQGATKRLDALEKIDDYLVKKPRDPQMLFWRALLLNELNRSDQALALYEQLTQEFPELAEPHNNLGVMYASKGQIDKARLSFEQALRNNPSYAAAQENLGDIWLLLAQESYARASKLEPQNRPIKNKILQLQPALQLISIKP